MFVKVEPLDRAKHGALKFKPATNYEFAATQATAPLPAAEVLEAARHFPIVFQDQAQGGEPGVVPQALLSLTQGNNAFVGPDGNWRAPYIPAHIRRYPFILGAIDAEEQFAIMIDVDAPQFKSGEGEPLFVAKEDGGELVAGPTIETAKDFLGRLQGQIEATRDLLAPLQEHDLLMVRQMEVRLDNRRTVLSGFRTVDEEKMRKLDDATLAGWVRSGLMNVIVAHLQSLGNVRELARLQPEALKEEVEETKQ